MLKVHSITVPVVLLGLTATTLPSAALSVQSIFSTDKDGWTLVGDVPTQLSWNPIGGNPGGFLYFEDAGSGGAFVQAPQKFLGSWTPLNGIGSLILDHKIIDAGDVVSILDYEIIIYGVADTARFTADPIVGEWVRIVAPLQESSWELSGSWPQLLTNVVAVRIRIEQVDNGGSTNRDVCGIDNVILSDGAGPTLPLLSAFDTDSQGWQLSADKGGALVWNATEGNPDGGLHFADFDSSGSRIEAPPEWLGDWSSLNGAAWLSFDHRVVTVGDSVQGFVPYEITLSGPGGSAEYSRRFSLTYDWRHIATPLEESPWSWFVTEGTWTGLLANVTNLAIRIEQVDNGPGARDEALIDNIELTSDPTSVPDDIPLSTFRLLGSFPNPFSLSTELAFSVLEDSEIDVAIYDLSGRLIRRLIDQVLPRGTSRVQWDGLDSNGTTVAAGVYFYRVSTADESRAGRLVVVR